MDRFDKRGARPQAAPAAETGGARGGRAAALEQARRQIAAGELMEAEASLRPYAARAEKDAEMLYLQALLCERRNQIPAAAELARKSLTISERSDTLIVLARCERFRGATDEAVAICDRILAKSPGSVAARLIKGSALEEAARFDEARAVIGPMVAEQEARGGPVEPNVLYEWCKLLVHDKKYDEATALIHEIVARTPNVNLKRVALRLEAKACDRKKDYKGAYEAASAANEIGRQEFSPALYADQISVLVDNWSREKMQKFPVSKCSSELPVFVAGMPRSGTSLIDQIIDAHAKAAGVGELATIEKFARELSTVWDPNREPPASFGKFDSFRWTRAAEAYVKEITALAAPGVERVVNKSLGNNRLVGMIARLFPKTRIIHAIRDPRDVAVSCFQGDFNNNFAWAARYEWIALAWEQSRRMMEHWKKSLDVPILDVHYEKLVKDPETEFPRIIEFLGLEWDEACTKFHESKRTVRTLSYDQVNRPLYTTSAGRNANYAPFMEGIVFPPYDPGV